MGSLATIGQSVAQIVGFAGMTAASGFGMVFPASAMIVGAIAIFSVLNSKDNNGLGEALSQIFQSINVLRQEMHEQFNIVNERLFKIYNTLHTYHKETLHHLNKIEDLLDFGIKEISELIKDTVMLEEGDKIITNFVMKKLPSSSENLEKNLETLSYLIYTLPKKNVLNGFGLNPENIESPDLKNQLEIRKHPVNNIGFYINYAKNILKIEDLPDGSEIPNLKIFYSMSEVFVKLVMQSLEHDYNVVNLAKKIINKENSKYIENIINVINQDNDKIINAMERLKTEDAIGKIIELYKNAINDFSDYISNEVAKISQEKGYNNLFDSLQDISTSHGTRHVYYRSNAIDHGDMQRQGVAIENLGGGNYEYVVDLQLHSDYVLADKLGLVSLMPSEYGFGYGFSGVVISGDICFALKGGFNLRPGYPAGRHCNKFDPTVNAYHAGNGGNHIYNLIKAKIAGLRNDAATSLSRKDEFQKHLNKIATYEDLANKYANLIGGNLNLNFTQHKVSHFWEMITGTSVQNKVPNLKDYSKTISDNGLVDHAYSKWQENDNYYKLQGEIYKTLFNDVKSFTHFIEENIETNLQEKKSEKANEIFETVMGYYSAWPDTFKEDILNSVEHNPRKLDRLEKLFDKAVKTEAFQMAMQKAELLAASGNPLIEFLDDDSDLSNSLVVSRETLEECLGYEETPLTMEHLIEFYCRVQCVDQFSNGCSEIYRGMMKNDETMANILGELKDLNDGEGISCNCFL